MILPTDEKSNYKVLEAGESLEIPDVIAKQIFDANLIEVIENENSTTNENKRQSSFKASGNTTEDATKKEIGQFDHGFK